MNTKMTQEFRLFKNVRSEWKVTLLEYFEEETSPIFQPARRRFLQLSMARLISILSYNFVQLQFFFVVSLIRPRFSFSSSSPNILPQKLKTRTNHTFSFAISHPLLMVMVQRI